MLKYRQSKKESPENTRKLRNISLPTHYCLRLLRLSDIPNQDMSLDLWCQCYEWAGGRVLWVTRVEVSEQKSVTPAPVYNCALWPGEHLKSPIQTIRFTGKHPWRKPAHQAAALLALWPRAVSLKPSHTLTLGPYRTVFEQPQCSQLVWNSTFDAVISNMLG